MSQLVFEADEKAISPLDESAAYEALFDKQGQSFKTLAEAFGNSPNLLPSDFIQFSELEEYKQKLRPIFHELQGKGFGIRVNKSVEYPTRLRDAKYPVEVVYFQGNWDLVHSRSISIVGSRKPTEEGIRRARKLSALLVKKGFTIASGLAAGIDRAAHIAAIKNGGNTIAVLGTPINEFYPKENQSLQRYIAQNHLVLSQVPFIRYSNEPFKSKRFYFPERNKLMSALSEATIIVEASETSGTLVQARAALEQGRKLFILESNFNNPRITWPEKFLKKGAIRVKDIDDVRL